MKDKLWPYTCASNGNCAEFARLNCNVPGSNPVALAARGRSNRRGPQRSCHVVRRQPATVVMFESEAMAKSRRKLAGA